jgi:uncharacterized protein with FMN-binding domain
MAKMNKKWIALCSTAIGAIYAAGFYATESQAVSQPSQPSVLSQVRTYSPDSAANAQAAPAVSADSSQSGGRTQGQYKNGKFQGVGSNRRGSIQVAVTIRNDKITDVEISNFAMHYSEDDVVGLPQEVLQKQSARVRNVSGATYSTQAFKEAVRDALSQARNA